ncbi:MAG: carboxynorspermidine decarboxylase [archaeon]
MESYGFLGFHTRKVKTPSYILDERLLENNLHILDSVQKRTGCSILLALKGYAMWSTFPQVKKYLKGICASGLNEARLGYEKFGKEVHVFSPAYKEEEFKEIIRYADYIIFNSFSQWEKFKKIIPKKIKCGLRVNPEYSEIKVKLYNPCAKNSRLGIMLKEFKGKDLTGITGLHFHAMCEQNSDTLERVIRVYEKKFGKYIKKMQWVNFGGGHHITRKDYDVNRLVKIINSFRKKYNNINVYLEPGEAVALNSGILVASVLDIVNNGMDIAILDTSAEAHMPDVIAMPYRPNVVGANIPNKKKYTYRLAGNTCLAGDVIGDYSFSKPLKVGDKLIFLDMAIYSMVKNTTFNGINLPSIAIFTKKKKLKVIKEFGYKDYMERLS